MLHCKACHPYGEKAAEHYETVNRVTIICDSGGNHTPEICTEHDSVNTAQNRETLNATPDK